MFKYYKLHEWCLNTVGRGLQLRNCDCTLMLIDATVQSSEQEEQDMETKWSEWWCNTWIVVEGDLYGRFKFYGPFNNHADATTFGDRLIEYNIIIRLIPTGEYPEAKT